MPIPEVILIRDDAAIAIDLIFPKAMVPQLQSAFAVAGETEGYRYLNDLFVEAIHQEIQRLQYSYKSHSPWPARRGSF